MRNGLLSWEGRVGIGGDLGAPALCTSGLTCVCTSLWSSVLRSRVSSLFLPASKGMSGKDGQLNSLTLSEPATSHTE